MLTFVLNIFCNCVTVFWRVRRCNLTFVQTTDGRAGELKGGILKEEVRAGIRIVILGFDVAKRQTFFKIFLTFRVLHVCALLLWHVE